MDRKTLRIVATFSEMAVTQRPYGTLTMDICQTDSSQLIIIRRDEPAQM